MPLFGPPDIEKLRQKSDFHGLVKALGHKDQAVRHEAEKALIELNSDAVVPLMLDTLASGDEHGVEAATRVLRSIGKPAAGWLAEFAKSGSPDNRSAAMAMLGRMGEPDGLPALLDLIKSASGNDELDTTVRTIGMLALRNGGTAAVDGLIVGLNDPATPVRLAAAMALENIPDPRAIEPLRKATNDNDPTVKAQAASALAANGA